MRIVIDMQGAQTKSCFRGINRIIKRLLLLIRSAKTKNHFRSINRYWLSLALAMARNADAHEVWIVLNAAFPESILDIRHAFAGVISEERIRVFEVPTPIAGHDPANAWRVSVAEKIREYFILGLKPDILLVTNGLSGRVV